MSRLFWCGVLIGVITAMALPAGAQQPFAYVDVNHVIVNSDRGKEVLKQLQGEFSARVADIRSREEALTALRSRIADPSNALSGESLEMLRREFQDSQLQLQRLTEDVERDVQKRRQELSNVLEKDVLDLLEMIRKEKGLALVFAKQGSGLVVADPTLEITDEVMRRLNTSR